MIKGSEINKFLSFALWDRSLLMVLFVIDLEGDCSLPLNLSLKYERTISLPLSGISNIGASIGIKMHSKPLSA